MTTTEYVPAPPVPAAPSVRMHEAAAASMTIRLRAVPGGVGRERIATLAALSGERLAEHCSTLLDRRSAWRRPTPAQLGRLHVPPTLGVHGYRLHAGLPAATAAAVPAAAGPAGVGLLSKRELEVLAASAGGEDRRAVGRSLGISGKTVGNHLAKVYAKLGVTNRMSAVAVAVKSGALDIGGAASPEQPFEPLPDEAAVHRRVADQLGVLAHLQREEAALRVDIACLRRDKLAAEQAYADLAGCPVS